jgi:hypothetical protein
MNTMRRWHIRLSLHERTVVTPGARDAGAFGEPELAACIHPFVSLYLNGYSENPPL